jgi:hypothetical protein
MPQRVATACRLAPDEPSCCRMSQVRAFSSKVGADGRNRLGSANPTHPPRRAGALGRTFRRRESPRAVREICQHRPQSPVQLDGRVSCDGTPRRAS